MGRFYGIRILNEVMTMEEVPKLWKQTTEQWLSENMQEPGDRNDNAVHNVALGRVVICSGYIYPWFFVQTDCKKIKGRTEKE